MKAALMLAAALMVLACGPAGATSLIERLGGEWTGKGLYTDVTGNPPERVTCRMTTKLPGNGARAEASGRCATVSGTAGFSITIRQGAGRLTALFSTSAAPETTDYGGREVGRSLVFDSIGQVVIEGRRYRSRILIQFERGDGFAMGEEVTHIGSGRKLTLFDMKFTRKGDR